MASEMRFGELRRWVESHGWVLERINGSHHVFRMPNGGHFAVPVHGGKVKPVYVRQIKKIIEGDQD